MIRNFLLSLDVNSVLRVMLQSHMGLERSTLSHNKEVGGFRDVGLPPYLENLLAYKVKKIYEVYEYH